MTKSDLENVVMMLLAFLGAECDFLTKWIIKSLYELFSLLTDDKEKISELVEIYRTGVEKKLEPKELEDYLIKNYMEILGIEELDA